MKQRDNIGIQNNQAQKNAKQEGRTEQGQGQRNQCLCSPKSNDSIQFNSSDPLTSHIHNTTNQPISQLRIDRIDLQK